MAHPRDGWKDTVRTARPRDPREDAVHGPTAEDGLNRGMTREVEPRERGESKPYKRRLLTQLDGGFLPGTRGPRPGSIINPHHRRTRLTSRTRTRGLLDSRSNPGKPYYFPDRGRDVSQRQGGAEARSSRTKGRQLAKEGVSSGTGVSDPEYQWSLGKSCPTSRVALTREKIFELDAWNPL